MSRNEVRAVDAELVYLARPWPPLPTRPPRALLCASFRHALPRSLGDLRRMLFGIALDEGHLVARRAGRQIDFWPARRFIHLAILTPRNGLHLNRLVQLASVISRLPPVARLLDVVE